MSLGRSEIQIVSTVSWVPLSGPQQNIIAHQILWKTIIIDWLVSVLTTPTFLDLRVSWKVQLLPYT